MKVKFISLASGSSGNCYYIGTEKYGILIDAGIAVRTIKKELKEALSAEEYEMVTAASEFKIKWFFFGNSDKNTEEEHIKESD